MTTADVTALPTAAQSFAIVYYRRLFVAPNPHAKPGDRTVGWRAHVWTEHVQHALRWPTREAAEKFAREWLFGDYEIMPLTNEAVATA